MRYERLYGRINREENGCLYKPELCLLYIPFHENLVIFNITPLLNEIIWPSYVTFELRIAL